MNRITLIFHLVTVLLLQDSAAVTTECAALWNCRNSIKERTYQWLQFSDSISRHHWQTYIHQICHNNQEELGCARHTVCQNATIVMEANIAIGDREFLCSTQGRQALLRMRQEDNCIGDAQAVQAQASHREFCYRYRRLITPDTAPLHICGMVNFMRRCDVMNGELSCSDISAYIIDQLWLVRISHQFSFCYNDAVTRAIGLPPVS